MIELLQTQSASPIRRPQPKGAIIAAVLDAFWDFNRPELYLWAHAIGIKAFRNMVPDDIARVVADVQRRSADPSLDPELEQWKTMFEMNVVDCTQAAPHLRYKLYKGWLVREEVLMTISNSPLRREGERSLLACLSLWRVSGWH